MQQLHDSPLRFSWVCHFFFVIGLNLLLYFRSSHFSLVVRMTTIPVSPQHTSIILTLYTDLLIGSPRQFINTYNNTSTLSISHLKSKASHRCDSTCPCVCWNTCFLRGYVISAKKSLPCYCKFHLGVAVDCGSPILYIGGSSVYIRLHVITCHYMSLHVIFVIPNRTTSSFKSQLGPCF